MNRTFAAVAAISSAALILGGCSSNAEGQATAAPALTLEEQYNAKMTSAKIQLAAGAYQDDIALCETLRTTAASGGDPVPLLVEKITRPPGLDSTTAHRIGRIKTMIPMLCDDQVPTLTRAQTDFNIFPETPRSPRTTPSSTRAAATTTSAAPVPAGPRTTFASGTFVVGTDVSAGNYSTNGPSASVGMCAYTFLPRKGATLEEAEGGATIFGPGYMELYEGQIVQSLGCTWTLDN